jgi:hypothetical protein
MCIIISMMYRTHLLYIQPGKREGGWLGEEEGEGGVGGVRQEEEEEEEEEEEKKEDEPMTI